MSDSPDPRYLYREGNVNTIINDTRFIAMLVHRKVIGYRLEEDGEDVEWHIMFYGGASIRVYYDENQLLRCQLLTSPREPISEAHKTEECEGLPSMEWRKACDG